MQYRNKFATSKSPQTCIVCVKALTPNAIYRSGTLATTGQLKKNKVETSSVHETMLKG